MKLSSSQNKKRKSTAYPILEKPTLFLGIIVCAVFVLGLWMASAQIDRVVRVEGRFIPAGRSQQIQHLEGGIVAHIDVSEGDFVHKGDILMGVESIKADATLGEGKSHLVSLQLRAARLKAEVKGDGFLAFSDDLRQEEGAEDEKTFFLSRQQRRQKDINIHQETIKQHQLELEESLSKQTFLLKEKEVATERRQMLETMVMRGVASKMDLLEAQSRENRLSTEIQAAEQVRPRLKAAINEEKARIDALKAGFETEAQKELVATLAEIERTKNILTAELDRVKRTEIKAPVDGTINRVSVTTVGGVVRAGDSLIEITPQAQESLIEAQAFPKDRGALRSDLPVKIRVSAYDSGTFGFLKGRVSEISADTVKDSRGASFYRVMILVDDVPPAYQNNPLLPGMTITGDIVTGRRTLLSHLVSPFRKFTHNMFRDSR